jgi:hypothetical protein
MHSSPLSNPNFQILLKLDQNNTLLSPSLTPLPLVEFYCSSTLSSLSYSVWKEEERMHANLVQYKKRRRRLVAAGLPG